MTLTQDQETQLLDDVASILVALQGNGLGSSEGMIHRVDKLERADEKTALEVRSLRTEFREWRLKVKWWGIGYTAGAVGIVYGINRFIPGGTP